MNNHSRFAPGGSISRRVVPWVLGVSLSLASVAALAQIWPTDERVPFRNYKDVLVLFDKLGYTRQAWKAGIREIPRVYLDDIPSQWRAHHSKLIQVAEKKGLFFRLLGPIVLRVNELIAADRARAQDIIERRVHGAAVSAEDENWLGQLAAQYEVIASPGPLDASQCAELLMRVDIVPPSLSLAQAAIESGWGASRFADEGNSLFGQWSWGKGLKPSEQRTEQVGDQRVAAFGSTGEAAYAYAHNLNTHAAYRDLRLKRAELRRSNQAITGAALAGTLLRYSERGQAYVNDLKTIMRQNQLADVDDARLRDMPVILLVLADDTAK